MRIVSHPQGLLRTTVLLLAVCALAGAATAASTKGAILLVLREGVEIAHLPAASGSAVLPGATVTTDRFGTAALVVAGGEYLLSSNSSAVMGPALDLNSGLVEISGALAVRSGGWRITPTANSHLTVVAAPDAVYVAVRDGSARVMAPSGHEISLASGRAAKLGRPIPAASAAPSDHRVRNILIGSAIVGGIAAAIVIYHATHKVVQTTGPCHACVVSPAQ